MHSLGSIGFFTARAFLTAFVTAVLLRYAQEYPTGWLAQHFAAVQGAPTWFTHDGTILVLGVLAVFEVAATKYAQARQIMDQVDTYLKPTVAVLVQLGVLTTLDTSFIDSATGSSAEPAAPAVTIGSYVLIPLVAVAVWYLAGKRRDVLEVLVNADPDDDLRIQRLIFWAEDIWVIAGLCFFVVFPIAMLVLIGVVLGTMWLIQKYLAHREKKTKVSCTDCGEKMYPTAIACGHCLAAAVQPRTIGWLGPKDTPAGDLDKHRLRLVEKKRCPVCATRLTESCVRQTCATCGHELMSDREFANAYIGHVTGRYPVVFAVCLLLSAIPLIGLIPGVIMYRMTLVAPFRQYMLPGRRLRLKLIVGLAFFALAIFQVIPLVGIIVVPLLATVNFLVHRTAYKRSALMPVPAVADKTAA